MIIELVLAFSPEELQEQTCAICGERFHGESVLAQVSDDVSAHLRMPFGYACRTCVEMLGCRSLPERFPTIEEYQEALRQYPEPIFRSDEEADALDEDRFNEICKASGVWRSSTKDAAHRGTETLD